MIDIGECVKRLDEVLRSLPNDEQEHTLQDYCAVVVEAIVAHAVLSRVPDYHDAPTCEGLWMAESGVHPGSWYCYRITAAQLTHPTVYGYARWYGPIPEPEEE